MGPGAIVHLELDPTNLHHFSTFPQTFRVQSQFELKLALILGEVVVDEKHHDLGTSHLLLDQAHVSNVNLPFYRLVDHISHAFKGFIVICCLYARDYDIIATTVLLYTGNFHR